MHRFILIIQNLCNIHAQNSLRLTVLLQATLRTPNDVAPTSLSRRGSLSDVCHSVTRTRRLRSATPNSLRVQHTHQHLLQRTQWNTATRKLAKFKEEVLKMAAISGKCPDSSRTSALYKSFTYLLTYLTMNITGCCLLYGRMLLKLNVHFVCIIIIFIRIRGHTLKLSKTKCTRDCWKYFFL